MCLWLLTACLGLLPSNPSQQSQIVIVQGLPTPILQPTTASMTTTSTSTTTTTTTTRMPSPTNPPMVTPMPTTAGTTTSVTTTPTTARPTTGKTVIPTISTEKIISSMTNILLTTPLIPSNISSIMVTNNSLDERTDIIILLCDNPDVICVSNPDDNTTGQLPIDPRLGTTTQGPSADYRVPNIDRYGSQNPSDTAVRFPRARRSASIRNSAQYIYENFNVNKHNIQKRQSNCRCVPAGTCVKSTYYGGGMIDIRIVSPTSTPCPTGQEYCCGSTTSALACGTLQTSPTPIVAPSAGQASYGEYPWQALILTKQNDYIAGGVLIDQLNVITVTHRLSTYIVSGTAPNVKVRLGEWDAAGTYEPIPFQEYTVSKVFTHPSFDPNTLQYDITVLRLSAPVPLTPMSGAATTINRACLPPTSTTTYTGQRCWVAGWGKDLFGVQGQYQQILKEVDVPIVAPATCQSQMQTARLGSSFVLDTTSFVCAGGEVNKDSCTGDGGSGLVCQVNGQWVVVGLVAWGLGCANANVPAAYVNVAALLPWIQQQVATA